MNGARTVDERLLALPLLLAAVGTGALALHTGQLNPFTSREALAATTFQFQETVATAADLHFFAKNELWRTLRSPVASLDSKLYALEGLCEQQDYELPKFLAEQLGGARPPNLDWQSALVQAAERVQSREPELRASLASGLFRSAQVFRDPRHPRQAALWAAVRMLGALIEPEHAVVLLEFLRVQDGLQTRQVALQALQGILLRDETSADALPAVVKERVGSLAETYLNPEFLISGENVALAANAIGAALLAKVPNLDDIRSRLAAVRRPVLERQIAIATARARGKADG